ncbi:MAG TPA: hypothetical protein VFL91_34070 [Thermomicrobiales bacterium]|nr:hypothetical protein [Thermomicrobiales bacterium]
MMHIDQVSAIAQQRIADLQREAEARRKAARIKAERTRPAAAPARPVLARRPA